MAFQYVAMIDTALFVLQNLADSEEVQSLCIEIRPTSSHVACDASSIKAEEESDAEEEKSPVPITFRRIKAEPEVSCVTVSTLNGFHKYGYFFFLEHVIYHEPKKVRKAVSLSGKIERM
jgi:hypothetical protein